MTTETDFAFFAGYVAAAAVTAYYATYAALNVLKIQDRLRERAANPPRVNSALPGAFPSIPEDQRVDFVLSARSFGVAAVMLIGVFAFTAGALVENGGRNPAAPLIYFLGGALLICMLLAVRGFHRMRKYAPPMSLDAVSAFGRGHHKPK